MARCDLCSKSGQSGNNVPFSKKKTRKRWSANIQRATIRVDGEPRRVHICTRCLRSQYKLAMKG